MQLTLATLLQTLLAIGILASVVFYLIGFYSALVFRRRSGQRTGRNGPETSLPAVSVLKPLKGLDADLFENLSTFCRQDYPRFQIVFGVADPKDPAIPVVRRLQATYPHVRIDLVIDGRIYGTNYKVSNLHHMYQAAKHDIILIADSDIRVPADYLRRIAPALEDADVGLVTCLYRAVNTGGLPTLIETLFINTDFAPMVLVAGVVEKPTYAFGATMALRRKTLDEIGGFLPLANFLADDYQLGNRIAARGQRLALSDLVVETVLAVGSWRRLLDHQLRWARTYRNCRPGGYFSSILTHGMLWATVNLIYNHCGPVASLVAVGMYALRIVTTSAIANRCLYAPLRLPEALLVPIKDLFISAVWVLCFLGDTVHWSGHEFRVMKDGQMVRVSPRALAPTPDVFPSPSAGDLVTDPARTWSPWPPRRADAEAQQSRPSRHL